MELQGQIEWECESIDYTEPVLKRRRTGQVDAYIDNHSESGSQRSTESPPSLGDMSSIEAADSSDRCHRLRASASPSSSPPCVAVGSQLCDANGNNQILYSNVSVCVAIIETKLAIITMFYRIIMLIGESQRRCSIFGEWRTSVLGCGIATRCWLFFW